MPKSKSVFVCRQCGAEAPRWNGKCQSCGAWNTLEEVEIAPSVRSSQSKSSKRANLTDRIAPLNAPDGRFDDSEVRYGTGISELDRVLGGGLVKGSIVLLGGEPGIGKSTLLLQICRYLGETKEILYVSGE